MKITKAIIPAAGLGTRFLPVTKAIPKEMIPLFNKPAIQEIVEECYASAINDLYFIISEQKEAIKKHFSKNESLLSLLQQNKKDYLITDLEKLINAIHIHYLEQREPKGLGDAILKARNEIGNEYFGILLPDDFIASERPTLASLMEIAQKEHASVIAVQEVPAHMLSSYGVISYTSLPSNTHSTPLHQITGVVEKPTPGSAPSNLAIVGRYVFSPDIFESLASIHASEGKELQLTDAIAHLIDSGHRVLAYTIQGRRFDTGNPVGWLEANLFYALQDPEHGAAVKKLLELFIK